MRKVIGQLKSVNKLINDNIERIQPDDVNFYTANIFKDLRDFVETTVTLLAGENEYSYQIFKRVKNKIFSQGKYKFLKQFHDLLQKSASHYTEVDDNATRLVFKYYEYLLKIKKILKQEKDIDVLPDLQKLEDLINQKNDQLEYYKKIQEVIDNPTSSRKRVELKDDLFYIERIKPFFINENVYYEITFKIANDFASKFDRQIAFSKKEILPNYATKLFFYEDSINIFGKNISVKIIEDYEISIRPCELKHFAYLFYGKDINFSRTIEYKTLMKILKKKHLNLLDIVLSDNDFYDRFKKYILKQTKNSQAKILELLDKSRDIILNNKPGANILRYLLFTMNNVIIKRQKGKEQNKYLSNLYIKNATIPFDKLPLSFFPSQHTPRFSDLEQCIDLNNREDELFARFIRNNTENKGYLYTSINEIKTFNNIDELIRNYNSKLYSGHIPNAELRKDKMKVYIYGYEKAVIEIINKIKSFFELGGIQGYSTTIETWLNTKDKKYIDDQQKRDALIKMFKDSRVALIYGSAGTGKTKLIEYISDYFNERPTQYNFLFLANTHTAVNNLKRRLSRIANAEFKTIKKISYRDSEEKYKTDILIVDESSTVSNDDMLAILERIDFKILLLVGDIYQIDPIRFGNWFYLAKQFFPHIELKETHRTKNQELLDFWQSVRNLENDIEEKITKNKFAEELNKFVFQREQKDEIVLCLNYNGLHGINNINTLFQQNNPNPEVKWGVYSFKVSDPVIFNDIGRVSFGNVLYNNLKGIIRNINIVYDENGNEDKIFFDIEIEESLTDTDIDGTDIELIETKEKTSIVRFFVNKNKSLDEDSNELKDDIIPFQIAYALSIHKSQGLEYDSVRIIITDEVEDQISHSIFYTAITRAKNNLKIYWSPATQARILKNMMHKFSNDDYHFIKNKIQSWKHSQQNLKK